jgi:hypothetical protein
MLVTAQPALAGPVITAAGDIAEGGAPNPGQIATARLVKKIDPKVALTLGDNQYPDGQLADYRASYDPTWGRFLKITRPVPGNHEYHVSGASGYFRYFGKRAHRRNGGNYSFDVGLWHLVALNSHSGWITDQQIRWVRRDLRRDRSRCELAYWHHPRWSSGTEHGSSATYNRLWGVLYRAGVDVVLNGHEHNYERFAAMTPGGQLAPGKGIREFVVGTGGASGYGFGSAIKGSQRRIADVPGVLRLTLRHRGYQWAFIGGGGRVRDRGNDRCHLPPSTSPKIAPQPTQVGTPQPLPFVEPIRPKVPPKLIVLMRR